LTVPITDDADRTAGKPKPVVPRIYQVCGWQAAAMLCSSGLVSEGMLNGEMTSD
jgi:hypothetical protein